MKLLAIVETVCLMFFALKASFVGAASANPRRHRLIAAYGPGAKQGALEVASELFAVQIVGAATSLDELKFLCQALPSNSTRLQSQKYDVALVQKIVCAAADAKVIPSQDEIVALTTEISTEIWIVSAIGAVQGKSGVKKLCDLINVPAASAIGLQGVLVKKSICAAAAVAHKVERSGRPAQFTLTAPLVNSIAPVSKVALPLVPIKPT